MGIKVKYDPVGGAALAAYATGVGNAQERRRKEALAILMQQDRMNRTQQENAMDRAARLAGDFVPIGGGMAGGNAPVTFDARGGFVAEGPPDSRTTLPGPMGAAPAPVAGIAGPGIHGIPAAGVPAAPGGDAPAEMVDPLTPLPVGSPLTAGREGFGPDMTMAPRWQVENVLRERVRYANQQIVGTREWMDNAQKQATERPPDNVMANPEAKRNYERWQGVVSKIFNDRTIDENRPESQKPVKDALNEMARLRRDTKMPTPAERVRANQAYGDEKTGEVFDEPGPGRVPGRVDADGDFIPRINGSEEVKAEEQAAKQQEAAQKAMQAADFEAWKREDAAIRSEYDPYPNGKDGDPNPQTLQQMLDEARKKYDDKWAPGGTGWNPPAASPPLAGSPAAPAEGTRVYDYPSGSITVTLPAAGSPASAPPVGEADPAAWMGGATQQPAAPERQALQAELTELEGRPQAQQFPAVKQRIAKIKGLIAGIDTKQKQAGAQSEAASQGLPSTQPGMRSRGKQASAKSPEKPFPRPKPTNAPSPEAAKLADRYLPRPRNAEEAKALGSGAMFIDPNGKIRVVP